MKIQINQPVSLLEAGNQPVNEDFLFPLHTQANPHERLFIVCDGKGSTTLGDSAARNIALQMARYFVRNRPPAQLDAEYLTKALRSSEEFLSKYKEDHPEGLHMGTTMSLMYIGDESITVAWVGDAPVYHFDAKAQTVLNLTRTGSEPSSAQIIGKDAPQEIQLTHIQIDKLHAHDMFFMPTAGIGQAVKLGDLANIFTHKDDQPGNPEEMLEQISKQSKLKATDNYSCYLIQLKEVRTSGATVIDTQAVGPVAEKEAETVPAGGPPIDNLTTKIVMGLLALVVFGGIGYMIYKYVISSQSEFDRYMTAGQQFEGRNRLDSAWYSYDLALTIAGTDSAKTRQAEDAQNQLIDRLNSEVNTLMGDSTQTALDSLSLAEKCLAVANMLHDGNQPKKAIEFYQYAQSLAGEQDLPDGGIPGIKLAEDYAQLADGFFQLPVPNYKEAAAYYQQSLTLFDSLNYQAERVDTVKARLNRSRVNFGAAPIPQVASSRSVEPANNTQQKRFTPESSRVAGPNSRISEQSLTNQEREEKRKRMDTGKRQYVEAQQKKSDYLYASAAENLQTAIPVLDGKGYYLLAYIHHSGLGVPRDKALALKYAQVAARKKWPHGEYLYGFLLLERSNRMDSINARPYIDRAAAANIREAVEIQLSLR
ncbi:protein phosphatase 2C domain-containing protein [Pontibacter sp. G13]|uniref:protein phosphatase 2C domain-containing protein n=1 Tax=Pontibacter sp. G13 TaxID=3074898 RepID=UPI00288A0D23|nr:protein phosphatase 2C domain-containing protein [Pontibacter sp. G13]WNJ19880.1 protein phosphatase 2C domain-containing protein [Pontibacter sp. G13]